jgi:hypothetical protein
VDQRLIGCGVHGWGGDQHFEFGPVRSLDGIARGPGLNSKG